MKVRIHVLDITKLDRLREENKFVRENIEPQDGEWWIKDKGVLFFLDKARIRYKI